MMHCVSENVDNIDTMLDGDENVQLLSGESSNQEGKQCGKSMELTGWDGDYYEWMAKAKEVRPICIAEDLEWSSMSNLHKLFWWIEACIQLLILTMFNFRTDRLRQTHYLKHHWMHYSGKLLFTTTVLDHHVSFILNRH